jgi:aquaporin Z
MRKLVVEFIGTFFLLLIMGMTVVDPGAGQFAGLAIGAALMIMVYAGAHISGAHYNPAVTLALWMRGRLPTAEVGPYIFTQCTATVVAAIAVLAFKGDPILRPDELRVIPGLLAEFAGTFAWCYVVLNVTTAKGTSGNQFYGLAIGATITAMTFAFASITSVAFNPAVAVGFTVIHKIGATNLWIFLVAEFAAGAAAGAVFKFLNPDDK